MFDTVEDKHIDIALILCDGFIHNVTPDDVRAYFNDKVPEAQVEEYCRTVTKVSDLPGVRQYILEAINSVSSSSVSKFVLVSTLLDSVITTPLFTNSLTPLRNMSEKEVEDLLQHWRQSPIVLKRQLYQLFHLLAFTLFSLLAPSTHNEAIGYPRRDVREHILKNFDPSEIEFKYDMLSAPKVDGIELYMPNIDALIIGSGSGAGVAAHTLANEGYKCLVLERGQYYSKLQFNFDEREALDNMYENKGLVPDSKLGILVFAGSVFGGGSTINWSACLKTTFKVRKEWYDDYGLEWAASENYDKAMDYVFQQMGATTEGVNHSFSNQVILNGSKKLGYPAKEIAQNIGHHENHDCGMCHLGCRYGVKQGSMECWFKDAAAKGSQFMAGVVVRKIIRSRSSGVATGVLCQDTTTGVTFKITGPKKYVVCGGSLQTPILLQKSGFKNKHIGSNLKLHPVTIVGGDFGKEVEMNHFNRPILTSVCTQVDDLDGKAHGPKIETALHSPILSAVLLPWASSTGARQDALKYNHTSSMLVITRDDSSGTVSYDPEKPNAIVLDYTVNLYDREALKAGIVCSAELLYIEGAKEIIHPQSDFPRFISNKPTEQRSNDDKDFVAWKKLALSTPLYDFTVPFGSAHQMSSCRMSGRGPKLGACDSRGKLFESDNVYVADSSSMPTASGVNPMVSTMAIARLTALGIAKDLREGDKAKF